LRIFLKFIEKIQVSLKSDRNKGYFTYLAQLFLEREMFQTKVVEKIKTHFMFHNFLRKSCHLWDNMEK